MELDDLSDVLNNKNLFHIKWKQLIKELIKEDEASKSSLEKANLKIAELESTIATYQAKEFIIENEKLILSQVITTLHQDLRKDGPVSKKINEVEQSVSGLNKAIEKLTSEIEKTNFLKDVNNFTTKAAAKCFEEIHIDNDDQDASIKSKENEQIVREDDVERHIIDVMLSDDELPSEHNDNEASEPSLLEPTLEQRTGSLRNSTANKSDNCDEVPLTDVTASSLQLLANRNERINESYSFTNEEIPSPSTTKSSDFTDVVESNEDLSVRNTHNTENSYETINTPLLSNTSFQILLGKLMDVQEGMGKEFVTESGKNSDVDTQIPSSSLRYNLKEENAVTLRNKTYFRDVKNAAVSNSIDSCSVNGRPSSQSSLKPKNNTHVKTTRNVGRPRAMGKKNNPSHPVPRFIKLTDHHDVFKKHSKPYPICYLCPYGDGNCRSYFWSMDHLRSHVKSYHQKEKQQLHPKNIEKSSSSNIDEG
ncbi:uncharacterized protein LOC135833767 [Planococcus citri]|uniref:uncharacterized protein LOC135833767 n=1 Tax=Planococcus citri TaxID=170843 RepID=UPI0031FA1196